MNLTERKHTMVPKKVCKIVLKRCDAVTKSNIKRKQKNAEVGNKNSPGVPAARIKVENEFVPNEITLTRITKGETSNAVTDTSPRSLADYCGGPVTMSTSDLQVNAQFPSKNLTDFKQFTQTNVAVKQEREEESHFSTGELVGCKTEADSREVGLQQNVEEVASNVSVHFISRIAFDSFSFPRTTLCVKTEETVEEEIVGKNEPLLSTVADNALKMADNDDRKPAENVNVLSDEWKNGSKMEEQKAEEGLITSELVGRLPKRLEDSEGASVTTFPKVLKIILKRCDAATKSNTKQNLASKVGNKDSPNFPAATLKVANEKVFRQKAVKSKENVVAENRPLDFNKGDSASKSATSKKNRAKVLQAGNSKTYLTSCMPERFFECFHCGVRFKAKHWVTRHIHSQHCGNSDTCAHCAGSVKKRELRLAVRKKFCRHCSKPFLNRRGLEQHLRNQTRETRCPALLCSVTFSHSCSLKAHLRSMHTDLKPYACDQCPARFFKKGELKQHLFVHSRERTHACSQCSAKFKSHDTLKGHLKTHLKERQQYGCVHCSCRFKGKNNLKRHLNIVHLGVEKSFVCDLCSARFYRKDTLKEHLFVHSKEKAFSCDQCPAKFSTASKLKRHASVHSNERPFKCEKCPKSFKSHRTLQRHARIHSGVNLYACDQCPAKFTAPFILKNHKETHSGKRATCNICSKTLKTKKVLELHLKNMHSSKRPFSCPKCPLTFLSLSRLKTHSTLHTGARRFRCAHCPAKFMQRDDLRRHLVVHAENKPFVCAHCLAGFSQRGTLVGHLRRRHKESSPASFPSKW